MNENIKDYVIKKCKEQNKTEIETNNLVIMCLFEIYQHNFFKNEYEHFSLMNFKEYNSLELYCPSLNNRLGAINQELPATLFSYHEKINHSYILNHPLGHKSDDFLSYHEKDSLNFDIILNKKNYQLIKQYQNIIENSSNMNDYINEFSKLLEENPQIYSILTSYISEEQTSLHKYYTDIIQTDFLNSSYFNEILDKINQYHINYKNKSNILIREEPEKTSDFLLKQPIAEGHIEKYNQDYDIALEVYNDSIFQNKAENTLKQLKTLTNKTIDNLAINREKVKNIVDKTIKHFKLEKKHVPYIIIDKFDNIQDNETNENILRKHSLNITGIYGTNSKQGIFDNQLLCDGNNVFSFNKRMSQKKGYVITIRNDLENIASALVLSNSNVIKLDKPVHKTDDIHYMFVSDKYKNQGYGKELVKTIAQISKDQEKHLSIAYTGDNHNAYFIQNIINKLNQLDEINPIYYCEAPRYNLLKDEIIDKYIKYNDTFEQAYIEIIFQHEHKSDFNKNMLTHISPENYTISEYNNLYNILEQEYKSIQHKNIKNPIKNKEELKKAIKTYKQDFLFLNPSIFFREQADNIIMKIKATTQKENIEKNINKSKMKPKAKML